MTAEELLRQVRARDAILQVLGESRLKVRGSSPLPTGMMEELREHKVPILALLMDEPPTMTPTLVSQEGSSHLLAWAAAASEDGLVQPEPVQFLETPLRPFTTAEVGRYCRCQMRILFMARSHRAISGWGRFTAEWWREMESQAIGALAALRSAIEVSVDVER